MNIIQWCSLALILVLTPSQGAPWDDDRIIGGVNALAGEFPYMAALFNNKAFHCGGAIIKERTILTAAHCLVDFVVDARNLSVLVGTNKLNKGGVRYNIQKAIIHPLYLNSSGARHDVGLVILSKNIAFNNITKAHPISNTTTGANVVVTLSGWGLTRYPNITAPNDLQKINLKTISHSECKKTFPDLDNQICTLTKAGEGACFGDSGSPLVDNKAIVGTVSYGIPCAKGYPDVFDRVSEDAKWINQNKQ